MFGVVWGDWRKAAGGGLLLLKEEERCRGGLSWATRPSGPAVSNEN
jgi:hypothetical protein